jgi:hypothetical protein
LTADQQRAAAGRGIPRFSRNALTAAGQMKRRSGSNAAAATQWLWQQGSSGTGSDTGCLGFALVTRAVGVAGVGVAAKETQQLTPQQLTPQQLTQSSWPMFSIVRRGGSGAGHEGAAQSSDAPLRRGGQGASAHRQQ